MPYHRKEKLLDIRSTNEYKFLRADIENNGIKDPILIRNVKGVLQIHVGEQRLLIAEQMGLKSLRSFVYNKYGGVYTQRINEIEDIIKRFQDVTVPTCDCIFRYIKHGQIKL